MKKINIIAFDVPYPANYGGAIDVFYKLKHMHQLGVEIHLHCFEYGRGKQELLEKYCQSVTYYKRKKGPKALLSKLPFIVKSRENLTLKMNLLSNDYPILFEGLHTCYFLGDEAFKHRLKMVRTHNIEHDYYMQLANNEPSPFKRKFFKSESKKLKKFESILSHANHCFNISKTDHNYFKNKLGSTCTTYIPAFHPSDNITSLTGSGDYVLYHGNLSVVENSLAAKFLMEHIFNNLNLPLKIAGLNPPNWLKKLGAKMKNVEFIENPSDQKLHELIQQAHVNYLYTNQTSGLKLKLLNALFNGRHCLVNEKMIQGSGVNSICHIVEDVTLTKSTLTTLMSEPFNASEIEKRKQVLEPYNNTANAQKIVDLL